MSGCSPACSQPGARRRLRHRSGGGPAGPGGGARGGQHRGQLPRRSAQPQRPGAALTPLGPEPCAQRAAAMPPLHSWRPRAWSLTPTLPQHRNGGGHRRSAQLWSLDSVRADLTRCPEMVQKQEAVGRHEVPVRRKGEGRGEAGRAGPSTLHWLQLPTLSSYLT